MLSPVADDNLANVTTIADVDAQNASFYGEFPFPWKPVSFQFPSDPLLASVMLCQTLGDWSHTLLPPTPRIWVAGCGTNQAVLTALAFPHSDVIGSDLSQQSLDICANVARGMNIRNLDLRRESINDAQHRDNLDLIICTGVIHHTADPEAALRVLSNALKPSGILELMVYNRFHRIPSSAAQAAIRLMRSGPGGTDFASALDFARRVIANLPPDGILSRAFAPLVNGPTAMIADTLLQPVEYAFTVSSLADLAKKCGLTVLVPCLNEQAKATGRLSWNMHWRDSELQRCYDSLDDLTRWQITNLLQLEASPMLWFYLSRRGPEARKSEAQIAASFLDTGFEKTNATQRQYLRRDDGRYALSPRTAAYTIGPDRASISAIIDAARPDLPMWDIFARLGLSTDFRTVHDALLRLTTPQFPFLKAVRS